MTWQESVGLAEEALSAATVPRSEEIISLIKRVNPTRLSLPEENEAQGYRLKAALQSLLLENYGDSFFFTNAEFDEDIALIKHRFLPWIDACHARLSSLSRKACDSVWAEGATCQRPPETPAQKGKRKSAGSDNPADLLTGAQCLVAEYDFAAAAETLALMGGGADASVVIKGAKLLIEECGNFEAAIRLLLAQQRQTLKDPRIRELLALAYHKNGLFSEARAVLETTTFYDLGKEALQAWADIAHRDGNNLLASRLLKKANEKEGYGADLANLHAEVEAALLAEAEPLLRRAQESFERDDLPRARLLAKQALDHCPRFAAAGALITAIDAMAIDHERERLWRAAEVAVGAERIAVLERLHSLSKEDAERARPLLQAEKALQKKAELRGEIEKLTALAAAGKWGKAYDLLCELLGHQAFADHRDEIAGVSPLFAALLGGSRLPNLAASRRKDAWLDFVAFMTSEECATIDRLEELRRNFKGAPGFEEKYRAALASAQEKARNEIAPLVAALAAEDHPTAAARMASGIRRYLHVLPPDERNRVAETVEHHLERLAPHPSKGDPLEEYRTALLIGDSVRAAMARELIGGDAAAAIDSEITDYFEIVAEPLAFDYLTDEEIDLRSGQDMKVIGRSGSIVVLRENDRSIIVVDTRDDDWSATRYSSPHFAGLTLSDAFPDDQIYLFSDLRTAWRARLAGAEARFLGTFNIADRFRLVENERPCGIYLSRDCPWEQYLHSMVEAEDGHLEVHMVRADTFKRLTRNAAHTVKNEGAVQCLRLSHSRDRFLLASEHNLKVLDRSLVQTCFQPEGGAVIGVDTTMEHVFVINVGAQELVLRDAGNAFSPRSLFNFRTKLPRPVYDPNVTWIEFGSDTFFITKDSTKGIFYDYNRDRSTETLAGIICTDTTGVVYAYRYDPANGLFKMTLIGLCLDRYMEWKEGCGPDLRPLQADQDAEIPRLLD